MKKFFVIILAISAIFSVYSCSKEVQNDEPVSDGQFVEVKFGVEYPSSDSKATVSATGEVKWEKGDEITLYYVAGGEAKSAAATVDAAGSYSTITAQIPAGDEPEAFFAVYPAGKGSISTEGEFTVDTDFVSDGTFKQAHIAAAYTTADEKKFVFKAATGLIKVALPANAVIEHGDSKLTIGKVSITCNTVDLACTGKVKAIVKSGKVAGFSEPESVKTVTSANVSSAAIQAGCVYVQTLPVESNAGIAVKMTGTNDEAIPAVGTSKLFSIYRGEIQPLENIAGNVVFDWYFSPDGTGNGRSAETPANFSNFVSMVDRTATVYGQWRLAGTTIHLADGTYTPAAQLKFQGSEAGTITIEGESMKGTVIDGSATAALTTPLAPIKFESAMNLNISKLTIQNSKSNENGGGMTFLGGKFTADSLYIFNNEAKLGNSGGIYLAGTERIIRNSTFQQNKASSYGGGFALGAGATGTTTIENCIFKGNAATTKTGGAFYAANTTLTTVNNCVFDSNSANQAGAIYADKAGAVIFVNASLFVANAITKTGYAANGGAIFMKNTTAKLGVYNCTFNYNHASSEDSSSSALNADRYVIANCTFVENSAVSHGVITSYSTAAHLGTLANSIVLTTSTTATHPSIGAGKNPDKDYNFLDSRNNLYNRLLDNFTAAAADATSKVGCTKATFGFGKSVDKENKSYAWSGDVSAITGYSKCNLSDVETLIKANTAIGEDFWNWLVSISATDVDVRGVKRSNPIWPGSYQQDGE